MENVAHALVCAEEALGSQMVTVSGKVLLVPLDHKSDFFGDKLTLMVYNFSQAFFVTNLEPTKFWDFVSLISEGLGYRR